MTVEAAAERLMQAALSGTPCAPVRDLLGDDVASAYEVQDLLVAEATRSGRTRSGWKVGLTSAAVQKQLGVDEPDFGRLFADMEVVDGGRVDAGGLMQPRIEAEIAFVMGAAIDGDPTEESLGDAIASVVPALEIVDSRIAGWDITLVDTVADNASCGLYVLGPGRSWGVAPDLAAVEMSMTADGVVVSQGMGRDCLGDPLRAALWVARTAQRRGEPLRPGDVVLAGALGPMVTVRAASTYRAELTGLGAVEVSFAAGEGPA